MVRVGGITYAIDPTAPAGQRIQDLRLKGEPLAADKKIKVAGWASVQEGVQGTAEPIWDVVSAYLRDKKVIKPVQINQPRLINVAGNPGLAT